MGLLPNVFIHKMANYNQTTLSYVLYITESISIDQHEVKEKIAKYCLLPVASFVLITFGNNLIEITVIYCSGATMSYLNELFIIRTAYT